MPIVNTGYQRATTLTIRKYDNLVLVSETVFDMKLQFVQSGVTYAALTANEMAELTNEDYIARADAYAAYITAIKQDDYPGISISSYSSRVENLTACPIN